MKGSPASRGVPPCFVEGCDGDGVHGFGPPGASAARAKHAARGFPTRYACTEHVERARTWWDSMLTTGLPPEAERKAAGR